MRSTLDKVLNLFNATEKKATAVLLVKMVVMAFLEVAGIASISPFLAVLGNKNLVTENEYLQRLYTSMEFTSELNFMIFLASGAILMLVLSSVFKAYVHYSKYWFCAERKHSISMYLLNFYVHQPYEFFLQKNSSELSKIILTEVQVVVSKIIVQLLHFASFFFVTLFIVTTLFVVDPFLAVFVSGGVGGFYILFYLGVRKLLGRIGAERVRENNLKFKLVSEVFGGIKELKVLGKEKSFVNLFEKPSFNACRAESLEQTFSLLPRYLVESAGFIVMFIAILYLKSENANLGEILPVMGVYALAGYRLMPALQGMYGASSSIRYGLPALDELLDNMRNARTQKNQKDIVAESVSFKDSFTIEGLTFFHPECETPTLEDINLKLKKNESLGIIGATGAGKSTLVEVLLGLLRAENGKLLVDGKSLNTDSLMRGWQTQIGYVPQFIFLSDDTIASNIAFGIPTDEVSLSRVQEVAKMAMIHDFIEELPEGYNTQVGERGVRLSGGQRQRIGIARALYNDPELIIFDEATSALDKNTEKQLMIAIEKVMGAKTIVMIAHRLETVQKCDKVIRLDKGRIIQEGSAEQVLSVH